MPNSNTSNILVQRLRTTGLLHANTNTKEGLLSYHKSLTQLKETQQNQGYISEKTINNNIIDFLYGIINSGKQIFCWIKGVNNDLVYQLEHQNKVIKFSMNKLLNTLNIKYFKSNWLQCHTIHVFSKKAKSGKHVYNIEFKHKA